MDFRTNSNLFPVISSTGVNMDNNSTSRVLNTYNQMEYPQVDSNIHTLNFTSMLLNSYPIESRTGFSNGSQNFDFGFTHLGFNNNKISESLRNIPIYKEVLEFKTIENRNSILGSTISTKSPLAVASKIKSEVVSTNHSLSLNGSENESSQHLNCVKYKNKTVVNDQNKTKFFQIENKSDSIGNYQPVLISSGATVVIPPGYIQVRKEKTINRKTKVITNCEHKDRKHYAKGLCSSCYHKGGRTKKAWSCEHTNRVHYAKGCCQDCYISVHSRRGKKKMARLINEDMNDIAKIINQGNSFVFAEGAF